MMLHFWQISLREKLGRILDIGLAKDVSSLSGFFKEMAMKACKIWTRIIKKREKFRCEVEVSALRYKILLIFPFSSFVHTTVYILHFGLIEDSP